MTKLNNRNLKSSELKARKAALLTEPVEPIDLERALSIGQLVEAFKKASIQARNIGLAADVFERMLADRQRPTIFLGLAGPLIAAGLRKVIRDLIAYGFVDCVVSTGAILYQDYYQAHGYRHFMGSPKANDKDLRALLIDRIYDTYVDEEKFIELDGTIGRFADTLPVGEYSSRSFLEALSGSLDDPESILVTAKRFGVPVFSPALNDSSIGIGLTEHFYRARKEGRKAITISSILDNYELTQIVVKSKATAAIYVAGGVPKNFVNDSIVMAYIFGRDTGGHKYAIQMTTDAPHWGGLSGCTLEEATSWGKVSAEAPTAMAFVEPSVSLPLVAGYAMQKKLFKNRPRLAYAWRGEELEEIKFQNRNLKKRP